MTLKEYAVSRGITYEAVVCVNGKDIGRMLPYSYYDFDITEALAKGGNELLVKITDLTAPFGPAEGWKSYSGIVRSVYLELRPETYLDDVFFHADTDGDYKNAQCTVEYSIAGNAAGHDMQYRARCTT